MREYAVAWHDSSEPYTIYAGGLAIGGGRLRLRGSAGYGPVVRVVLGREIAAVRRARVGERLGGFPSLRLDLGKGRSLMVASLTGIGVLCELSDTLMRLTG